MNARGSIGRAEAIATILFAASDGGTKLDYDATAKLRGGPARLAGRRADDAVQQLVGDFFARFAAAVPVATPVESPSASVRPTPAAIPPAQTQPTSARTKALWIGIGAAACTAITAAAAILLSRNRSR